MDSCAWLNPIYYSYSILVLLRLTGWAPIAQVISVRRSVRSCCTMYRHVKSGKYFQLPALRDKDVSTLSTLPLHPSLRTAEPIPKATTMCSSCFAYVYSYDPGGRALEMSGCRPHRYKSVGTSCSGHCARVEEEWLCIVCVHKSCKKARCPILMHPLVDQIIRGQLARSFCWGTFSLAQASPA